MCRDGRERLEKTINKKKEELNKIASMKDADKDKLLELSRELDELIYQYYLLVNTSS